MENANDVQRAFIATGLTRWDGHVPAAMPDVVAAEEPLEIQLEYGEANGRQVRSISVTMRTPGDDLHLAVGFLVSEGVVRDSDEIESVSYAQGSAAGAEEQVEGAVLSVSDAGNIVRVALAAGVEVAPAALQRNFFTTSSCGICGKASLLALQTMCPPRARNTFCLSPVVVSALPGALRAAQTLFERTGGLHGAGLFDAAGKLHTACEDVGRHNAVDKLLGAEFLAGRTPLRDRLLMLSGRCSFELMQKALMAGVPAVVAVGAPSSLAVEAARRFDMLLIGFVRGERFNVYSGAERVRIEPASGLAGFESGGESQ